MKEQHFKYVLYFIAITIVVTIGIQFYWNIENYKTNKQHIVNEVQIAFDNSIEAYYAEFTKNSTISYIDTDTSKVQSQKNITDIFDRIDFNTIDTTKVSGIHISDASINFSPSNSTTEQPIYASTVKIFHGKKAADSVNNLQGLATKLIISMRSDSINLNSLSFFMAKELERKKINIDYGFKHFKKDSSFYTYNIAQHSPIWLSTFSKSTYLASNEKLQLMYSNPTINILKRSSTGIFLSLILSLSIIISLLVLLSIIRKQKQLAAIKNDLISNITHEFKTPISTVAAAIEAIKNFNVQDDRIKTNSYLEIGDQQLKKLHLMVEKLLETATLDSDKLLLNKESVNLVGMLHNITAKHRMLADGKTILFSSNINELEVKVDPFHFENAISNLLDNAVKYGGDSIEVNLNSLLSAVEITVADTGNAIDKSQREKIFDKFYRIPTGNRHDVKGFGIGLFYTKKIIEKHNGSLSLIPNSKNTIFKVTI